ncbi:hypothetical protein [Roseateles sp. LYH14W]|uniref:Uncharacterized protein n=1 Tax=Pelomonas parva TaxID=3299032 RepID=A0ABW7EXA5_9BURK
MSRTRSFLAGMTACATFIAAVTLLTGAKAPPTKFEEIDVGRINIREPDGQLRMVISNREQFPGTPWKGAEQPRPDRRTMAGMLFINDEGTENGGLIQKGAIGADGKVNAGLSLTFDRFRTDQVLQLLHAEQDGRVRTEIAINDEADPLKLDLPQRKELLREFSTLPTEERRAEMAKLRAEGLLPQNRVRIGTTADRASALQLSDAQGRPRLLLLVTADGKPSIQMLDDKGKVARTISLDTAL